MNATRHLLFLQSLIWLCDMQAFFPFLQQLAQRCDIRLVRTALVILRLLCSSPGLLLRVRSLADSLASPRISSSAWEKRIHKLLDSPNWSDRLVAQFLWHQADDLLTQAFDSGRDALILWDESVWEKPETLHDPALGSVISSKAKRLNRVRNNYYSPPKAHTCVAGFRVNAMVVATSKRSRLARCDYWSSRHHSEDYYALQRRDMLESAMMTWGHGAIHIFDRGYAGWPWLQELGVYQTRFIMRWKTKYHLWANGKEMKAHHSVSGWPRVKIRVRDAIRRQKTARWVVWRQVAHPKAPEQAMWLVVCSDKKRSPWYLLTSEKVESQEDAKRIIEMYSRRWEVEQHFRRMKTDLSSQSLQLRVHQKRLKMLGLLALVHNALMMLNEQQELKMSLLAQCVPRRGRRLNQEIKVAFSRLRQARGKLEEWLSKSQDSTWSSAPRAVLALLGLPP